MTTPGASPSITSLSDAQALQALTLGLDQQQRLPDRTRLSELDTQTRQAATSLARDLDLSIAADTRPASAGNLARDTLTYLATAHPRLASTIERAITLSSDNTQAGTERIEPVTLAIGALVVLALQTEVSLERGSSGKWKFAYRKKP